MSITYILITVQYRYEYEITDNDTTIFEAKNKPPVKKRCSKKKIKQPTDANSKANNTLIHMPIFNSL